MRNQKALNNIDDSKSQPISRLIAAREITPEITVITTLNVFPIYSYYTT